MTFSVAVVGLGSRGLGVLERIVTLAKLAGPQAGPVRVEVIDPRCDGAGVHDTDQPDYLLLNTTAAHVSMFPDAHTVGDAVDAPGPNLLDWVTARGDRIADDGYTVGRTGRAVRPHDFLPRRVLGEYLGWVLAEVLRRAPAHVTVRLHRAEAVDLVGAADGGLTTVLDDGTRLHTRYAFLTTGYTANVEAPATGRLVVEPYPLPERVAAIGPGDSVAIGGFGLSAMDVMSALTVGRGGRFTTVDGQLRYQPSGREPVMLFYSRSGAPCRARPEVVEFGPRYQPMVFTHAAIDAVRARRGGRLDFQADIMPLVCTEMRIAYRRCQARNLGGDAEARLLAELREAAGAGMSDGAGPAGGGGADGGGGPAGVVAVLDRLDERLDLFDAAAAFDGATDILLDDSAAYQKWLADVLSRDLAEGRLGFAGSPLKAGLDIMRDLRDTFRYAVDFGGLTPASLDDFIGRIVPAVNRAVVGPQFERHTELLALMNAGIASAPFGPAPAVSWSEVDGRWTIASTRLGLPHRQQVDWLVAAYVPPPAVARSASPLLAAMYRRGMIRPHQPSSRLVLGIDVDADQHPVAADGQSDRRLWTLGPLCEGATFYNNLVPSPNTWSRPMADAHRCVAAMFAAERDRVAALA